MSVERDTMPRGDGEPGSYERAVAEAVECALVEDLGDTGDITAALVAETATARFALRALARAGCSPVATASPRRSAASGPICSCAGTPTTARCSNRATP